MAEKKRLQLTKRENQIMSVLYRHGPSTVADISEGVENAPTATALRTLLRILEKKGYVRRTTSGRKNVYEPTIPRREAAGPALRHVLDTFFRGSLSDAVAAHLSDPSAEVDHEELERLARLIDESKDEER